MTWEEYKEEIELIEKQNNVEHDLYNVIYTVLNERLVFKNVSVRNICDRKRTVGQEEKNFWGIKGFPDFILLNKKYGIKEQQEKMILGAVEAKYIGKEMLSDIDDVTQLIGHLLWFDHVIYTNGVEWRIYRNNWQNLSQQDLKDLQNETYFIRGDSQEIKEKWRKIDNLLLHDYNLEELKPTCFVLRKVVYSNKLIWDYLEWKRLTYFLNHMELE